ncbi:hypothetical protein ACJ41O_007199 [Fusarium nematophilum]
MVDTNSSVIIVGAGVFGLSTAIHLQQRGHKNITIFDKQDFHASRYSPFEGGDSPSSDTLKIIRSAYGTEYLLQDLASRAIQEWKNWNIASGQDLFTNSGWARLTDIGRPQDIDIATFESLSKVGLGHTQYFLQSPEDQQRAKKDGLAGPLFDQFRRRERGLPIDGVFDCNAGIVQADLACSYALDLAERAGAKTYFGKERGEFSQFVRGDTNPSRLGHQIVPELQPFLTATAGNFVYIKVPEHLQDRFKADVFPVWGWNYSGASDGGGLGGFPLDRNGYLKFIYRSPNWTSPSESSSGIPISVAASDEEVRSRGAPLVAIEGTKAFVRENIPELVGAEIVAAKLCWYTDAIDLNFVIDRVPNTSGLVVVTGGSNHGFKFLPVLGEYVVDVLEGKSNEYTRLWQWRSPTEDQTTSIQENTLSPENIWHKQKLASSDDFR